jgi:hypothetical protein
VGSDVYATECAFFDSAPSCKIDRIAPDGTKTIIEDGFIDGPTSLWFDEPTNSLIWGAFRADRVGSHSLQAPIGSVSTVFNQLAAPFGVVSNRDAIYVSVWGYMDPGHKLDTIQRRVRSDLTQGESFQLTDAVPQESHPFHACAFDIDASYVYWAESQTGNVVRRPLSLSFSAGPSTAILTHVPGNARGLAVDGQTIFVTTYGQPTAVPPGMLFRADNQPGAVPTQIASIPSILEDVAVDAKAIYIAGPSSGTIWKMAR